jgi:enamine deaminase RidA (YjgF/YER057c/UK114 family)
VPVDLKDPDGLRAAPNYSHLAITRPGRLVFIAGQVAAGPNGEIVGAGDLAAQARQAYRNVVTAVRGAGGDVRDIAKITIYVVEHTAAKLPVVRAAREEVFGTHRPASTLVGVQALASPEYLIEVEAIAVLDA